ncbi:traB domain-containing protein-like [Paramacrobiotus metropolitanus]|uniref:traB domain-containing protein-like n=1 Tax=Paramacrobiotus metropolitanus TaxID=2943436 RepID=UPI0024460137|nr:traB domain-containing protein-like [Paramacrobiotus metropolitanus]
MEDGSGNQQRKDGHDEMSHSGVSGLDGSHAAQGDGHGDYTIPDILKPIPTGLPFPVPAGRLRSPKLRIANPALPDTVTILEHPPSGGRVYLVGTMHNADKSQEDVGLTIRMTIQGFTLQRLVAFYLKTYGLSVDMRAAYTEAMSLPDCTLYLADRPRSITRQRIRAAPLRERLWLLRMRIRDTRTGMEAFWQQDAETRRALMETKKEKFATACPTVYRVMVQERDVWLAEALKRSVAQPLMTTEGPRGRVAVGVVGMWHVAGIHRAWNGPRPSSDALRKLAEVPPASKLRKIISTPFGDIKSRIRFNQKFARNMFFLYQRSD